MPFTYKRQIIFNVFKKLPNELALKESKTNELLDFKSIVHV